MLIKYIFYNHLSACNKYNSQIKQFFANLITISLKQLIKHADLYMSYTFIPSISNSKLVQKGP